MFNWHSKRQGDKNGGWGERRQVCKMAQQVTNGYLHNLVSVSYDDKIMAYYVESEAIEHNLPKLPARVFRKDQRLNAQAEFGKRTTKRRNVKHS